MGAGWIAGDVRGRALLSRRLGSAGARELAASPSVAAAVTVLAAGPYGRAVRPGQELADAEHAVGAVTLWHLRVLAGWQPQRGTEVVRQLAGWFEIANAVEHARALSGQAPGPYYELGRLATAWPRLRVAASSEQLRAALAASPWEDPGSGAPAAVAMSMGLSWAARVAAAVPEARAWALGGAALLVARQRFSASGELPGPVARRLNVVLGAQAEASDWDAYVRTARPDARWVLADLTSADDLWRAEAGWWTRTDRDAAMLLRARRAGRGPLTGMVALLAVDAWRVRAALQIAARGGRPLEAFDALV